MNVVGTVESLWRYPVKGMAGEEQKRAFIGFAGVYGDRLYAFKTSAGIAGFPFLTPREQAQMLRYQPVFRDQAQMSQPVNLADAEGLGPGITPIYADADGRMVDVQTPSGETLPIDDPELIRRLRENIQDRHELSLMRSERALTDCRPISLFSLETVAGLGEELGVALDKRRFRANLYIKLAAGLPFGEHDWVGRKLRIGQKAILAIVDPIPRCKMITLDPDTTQANPEVVKKVARDHSGNAGIYAAVMVEGMISVNDEIVLSD